SVCRGGRPQQRLRCSVSPGEESAEWPTDPKEFQQVRATMTLVIPAIDLRRGQCVRLYQGSYSKETVYFDDPVKMAKLWRVQNARTLHLVDLDAARGDHDNNRKQIAAICAALDIPVQLGGGVR